MYIRAQVMWLSIASVKISSRAVPEMTSSWYWAVATVGWKSVDAWKLNRDSSQCWRIHAIWDVRQTSWTLSADSAPGGRNVSCASVTKPLTTSTRATQVWKCTWKWLTCASVVSSSRTHYDRFLLSFLSYTWHKMLHFSDVKAFVRPIKLFCGMLLDEEVFSSLLYDMTW